MAIFLKCPVCGESAVVKPELADQENRIFRCKNGHQFKIAVGKPVKPQSQDIWDHMPGWARLLNDMSKGKKVGG